MIQSDNFGYFFFSYDWVMIAAALLIGFILIIFKPYWAFLFAIFISISQSQHTMTFTRFAEKMQYFNFYDACMLIAILAFIKEGVFNNQLKVPKMALVILMVLFISLFNRGFDTGITSGALRIFRFGLDLPILFILAATMVNDEKRVRSLLITLIAATFCAVIQNLFLILRTSALVGDDPVLLRTIVYELARPEIWLIAGPFIVAGRISRPWLQMAIGSILYFGLVAQQSRSTFLAFFMALGLFYFWFLRGPYAFRKKRIMPLVVAGLGSVALLVLLNLTSITEHLWNKTLNTMEHRHTDPSLDSRKFNFYREGRDFLESNPYNMLTGHGLAYFEKYHAAMGHLGYITYLSQTGVMGFLVYAILFPISVIIPARRLFLQTDLSPAQTHAAALAGACILFQGCLYIFSGAYLYKSFYPGILAGAIWRMSLNQTLSKEIAMQSIDATDQPSSFHELKNFG
jgi:hypothetical protein